MPLDANHEQALNLNEERAKNTALDSELKQIELDTARGKLADVDELLAKYCALLETIAATIKGSALEDDRKEDCFSAIRDALKEGTG